MSTLLHLCLALLYVGKVDANYNPDVDLTTPQIIRRHGYPAEAHTIQTEDGYLLTLHRIPGRRKSNGHLRDTSNPQQHTNTSEKNHSNEIVPLTATTERPVTSFPVFLQHGLLGSSADWLFLGPENALAYLLAEEGYDVWLGNARGNTYSRGHVTLPTEDPKYWDFSWHEMGYYDLPAAIDHILNTTGANSVMYCGHSMGTTMFYVMASTRVEYNNKVVAMFSLAPVAFVSRMKSPIRLLAPFANDFEFISRLLGKGEFLPQNKIIHLLAKYGCELVATEQKICEDIIFVLAGFDADQFNVSMLPLVLNHTPAGTSTKTLVHYAQEIRSAGFRQYDHGVEQNKVVYNNSMPPPYDLSQINVPVEFYYAANDWLASTMDVNELYQVIKNKLGKTIVKLPGFNHLDFLWGKDAKRLVYDPVINKMKKIVPPFVSLDKASTVLKACNDLPSYHLSSMKEKAMPIIKQKASQLKNVASPIIKKSLCHIKQNSEYLSRKAMCNINKIRSSPQFKKKLDTIKKFKIFMDLKNDKKTSECRKAVEDVPKLAKSIKSVKQMKGHD